MNNLNIDDVIDKNLEDIIKKENVIGMAPGTKITNSIDTNELCLTIFVSKKVLEDQLAKEDIIPAEIENIKTDVVEIGIAIGIMINEFEAVMG